MVSPSVEDSEEGALASGVEVTIKATAEDIKGDIAEGKEEAMGEVTAEAMEAVTAEEVTVAATKNHPKQLSLK